MAGPESPARVKRRVTQEWAPLAQLADWAANPRATHRAGAGAFERGSFLVRARIAEIEGTDPPGPGSGTLVTEPRWVPSDVSA